MAKTKINSNVTVYGIYHNDKCLYIGQSKNVKVRWDTHRKDIKNKKHKIKQLNKYSVDELDFKVMCEVNTDNSLVTMLTEALINSIHKPLNKIVWQAGFHIVTFARVKPDLATNLLNVIINYYGGKVYDV